MLTEFYNLFKTCPIANFRLIKASDKFLKSQFLPVIKLYNKFQNMPFLNKSLIQRGLTQYGFGFYIKVHLSMISITHCFCYSFTLIITCSWSYRIYMAPIILILWMDLRIWKWAKIKWKYNFLYYQWSICFWHESVSPSCEN